MTDQTPRSPRAGGAILALVILAGAVAGAATGEPSLGVVVGIAIGVVAAIAVWLLDRRG